VNDVGEIRSMLTDEDRRELLMRAFDMQFRIMEMMLQVLEPPQVVFNVE
jgi:hypothetical protein